MAILMIVLGVLTMLVTMFLGLKNMAKLTNEDADFDKVMRSHIYYAFPAFLGLLLFIGGAIVAIIN